MRPHHRILTLVLTLLLTAACSPAAPTPPPTPRPETAANSAVSSQVAQLGQAARLETTLKGAWSPARFGGSVGFERLIAGMNKKYGLSIKPQFTPGIDEQAMA